MKNSKFNLLHLVIITIRLAFSVASTPSYEPSKEPTTFAPSTIGPTFSPTIFEVPDIKDNYPKISIPYYCHPLNIYVLT